jgi:hypothetical protein
MSIPPRPVTLAASALLVLAACGYGYYDPCPWCSLDSLGSLESEGDVAPRLWRQSANGGWVLDASGDPVRFDARSGFLRFGRTTYVNARADERGRVRFEDRVIAEVRLVAGRNGPVAVLVGANGYALDLFGAEGELAWQATDVPVGPGLAPAEALPEGAIDPAPRAIASEPESVVGAGPILAPGEPAWPDEGKGPVEFRDLGEAR